MDHDPTALYGYTPWPCEFTDVVAGLALMAGSEVEISLRRGMHGEEPMRMSGRLGLGRDAPFEGTGWTYYPIGDRDGDGFRICEQEFTDALMIPGMVWIEVREEVLHVARRHLPWEADNEAAA